MIDLHVQKSLHTAEGNQLLDVAFQVKEGHLLALYGESGVGKTTLLRMLAGLTLPAAGYIRVGGKPWFDDSARINLSPQKREVGLVFQQYALFPHMTVRQNLEYAVNKPTQKEWIDELLALSNLTELAQRRPDTLSGGQQQRVALIRALARKPRLLLLDEPLSSLDSLTRRRLQQEIIRLHQHFGMTTLLVSHDADEVMRMADEVIILERGKIHRQGKPADVFHELAIPAANLPKPEQVVWLQGVIQTITVTESGWLLELQTGDILHQIRLGKEIPGDFSQQFPWQVGDRVAVPLSYLPPSIGQIRQW